MASKIQVERLFDGAVCRITLNAPKANILDGVMMTETTETVQGLRGERDLKLLTFTGAGDHFSFGASVEEHVKENVAGMLSTFHGMFYALADLEVPTLSLVRGNCLGGGMELAVACQWVVADRTARFGQPEIKLACLPPVACAVLPLRVGQAATDDLILTGRTVKAEEALAIGLVDRLVPEGEDPEGSVNSWIEKHILPLSAAALRITAATARLELNRRLRADLPQIEHLYLEKLMATADASEGLAAFMEKRPPKWRNS